MQRERNDDINAQLLKPVMKTRWPWFVTVVVAGLLFLGAIGAFGYQLYWGIGVYGIKRPVFWAVDITNFVFWIGISHAGTLISAILRVTGAEWRRPVTRCAEAITVFFFMREGMFPNIHLGRPAESY